MKISTAAAPTRVISKWANPQQQWLVERGAAPTMLVGGINSGKTIGCVLKGLALLHKYPGSRLAVVRRSYNQLLKTTMESWYKWCHPKMYDKGNRTEAVLDLNCGSRVYFIHLDQPNSLDLLAGLELNFAYVSQAEEISEKAWDLLDVRVGRWDGAVIPEEDFEECGGRENWPWRSEAGVCVPPRYIFGEGYVTDEGHWLYDRFAEDSPNREKWAAQGYESKIVFSEENIYAVKANIDAALSKDDEYVRRYVRPEWGNPEGKIFNIDRRSLLQPDPALVERILRTMKLHRSLDHGEYNPTCCLWHATDSRGNVFTFREYYVGEALVSDHRRAIFELSKNDVVINHMGAPRYHSNVADPSIFAKNRGRSLMTNHEWSVADEYTDTKLMPRETTINWSPANNNEEATISRMKEYLRIDSTHHHPVTGELGAPHLYFIMKTKDYPNGCSRVVREISAQSRKRAKTGDREIWLDERDDKVVDHGYDAEKYFIVGRPSLGPVEPPAPVPPGFMRISDYEAAESRLISERGIREGRRGVSKLGYGE